MHCASLVEWVQSGHPPACGHRLSGTAICLSAVSAKPSLPQNHTHRYTHRHTHTHTKLFSNADVTNRKHLAWALCIQSLPQNLQDVLRETDVCTSKRSLSPVNSEGRENVPPVVSLAEGKFTLDEEQFAVFCHVMYFFCGLPCKTDYSFNLVQWKIDINFVNNADLSEYNRSVYQSLYANMFHMDISAL